MSVPAPEGYDAPAGEDSPVDVRRIVVTEDVRFDGDEVLALHASDATHESVLGARDQRGTPLGERPGEPKAIGSASGSAGKRTPATSRCSSSPENGWIDLRVEFEDAAGNRAE